MQLKSFRVRKFRNIEDSGKVELLGPLTCVVGKNQSGKSALLRALHKFNPHRDEPYDMGREWPRGQRTKRNDKQVVCEVHFDLTQEEVNALGALAGRPQTISEQSVVVTKNYAGTYEIQFPGARAIFLNPLDPNSIDSILQSPPKPTEPVDHDFKQAATNYIAEAERCAKEGRFNELADLRTRHTEEMRQHVVDEDPERQHDNEEKFINDYTAYMKKVDAELNVALTLYQKAREYIVHKLPKFVYMDDYKTFRGRAALDSLRERRNNQGGDLSEEDETFLMILQLAGLDLDHLIEQGQSNRQEIIHDRQIDLQDAATTLTNEVAGRWGQNEYEVQFRADGQIFFTEIEETNRNVGMIPLEEQSKGFQWFFSFDLHFMHDSEGTFEGCVLLLDEPGLHLHPGAQADLLKRLDAYAKKNTLIYTTHLPFLVDLRDPKRIKVINQTKAGAVISDDLGASQADERLTLQAALGMRANQSYLVSDRNLLVEGVHDYWIIAELSRIFEREGRPCVPAEVLITVAGSASEIVPLATFMIGQRLDVVALFDSDSAGTQAEEKLLKTWITRYSETRAETLLIGDAIEMSRGTATIEDTFPEDYYLKKTRESHEKKLTGKGLSTDAIGLSGSGPILPRLKQCFDKIDVDFNKGSVAKRIRRDLIQCRSIADLPNGLVERAESLLTALCRAFDASKTRRGSGIVTEERPQGALTTPAPPHTVSGPPGGARSPA